MTTANDLNFQVVQPPHRPGLQNPPPSHRSHRSQRPRPGHHHRSRSTEPPRPPSPPRTGRRSPATEMKNARKASSAQATPATWATAEKKTAPKPAADVVTTPGGTTRRAGGLTPSSHAKGRLPTSAAAEDGRCLLPLQQFRGRFRRFPPLFRRPSPAPQRHYPATTTAPLDGESSESSLPELVNSDSMKDDSDATDSNGEACLVENTLQTFRRTDGADPWQMANHATAHPPYDELLLDSGSSTHLCSTNFNSI